MSLPGSQITFARDFDFAEPLFAEVIVSAVRSLEGDDSKHEVISQGLEFWKEHSPKKWRLYVQADGMVPVPHSLGGEHRVPILSVLELGGACYAMRSCGNFQTIVKSLHAHDEFVSTLFTVQAAYLCFVQPRITELEFSPRVMARGGAKRPDFAFNSPIGRVICECKDMQSMGRIKRLPDREVLRAFEKAIAAVHIPSDLRPEVKFSSRPNHGLKRLSKQVAAALQELGMKRSTIFLKINFGDTGRSISVCLSERKLPPRLIGARNLFSVSSESASFAENVCNAPLLLGVDKEDATAIGHQIRDANQQLPTHGPTLIFIKPIHNASTDTAAKRRIHEREYENLWGIFFLKGTGWHFVGRGRVEEALKKVFPTLFLGGSPKP